MALWERYQQCLVTTDPTELVLIIDQFERVMLAGAEPPSWMWAWGPHVMSQPLRTAAVMAAMNHPAEARAPYQRARYSSWAWAYYRHQNFAALSGAWETRERSGMSASSSM